MPETMDKEAFRKQITDAYEKLGQCLHAFENAPEGTFDAEDDIDILGNLTDYWIMQNTERDGGLFDEAFEYLENMPSVKK